VENQKEGGAINLLFRTLPKYKGGKKLSWEKGVGGRDGTSRRVRRGHGTQITRKVLRGGVRVEKGGSFESATKAGALWSKWGTKKQFVFDLK